MKINVLTTHIPKIFRFFKAHYSEVCVHVLSWSVFIGGICLVVTGNIPVEKIRIQWMRQSIPLELFEASHFLNSIIGVMLLFLASAIRRRLDSAYIFISGLLILSCILSLLKGFNWELSLFLFIILLCLLPTKPFFYKKASLLTGHVGKAWLLSIFGVIAGAFMIGLWNYRYVQYSDELWWKFAFNEEAGRFLRVNTGVVLFIFFFSVTRLFRTIQFKSSPDSYERVQQAFEIVNRSENIDAFRALFGDKKFLFSKSGQSFLMYACRPRSFVVLGDPVGSKDEWKELIESLRVLADQYDVIPIFTEIKKDYLHLYLDAGLDVVKLGEEARIKLSQFSLSGGEMSEFRRTVKRCEEGGCEFSILSPSETFQHLNEIKDISNQWLQHKNVKEKAFSLGYFDERYLGFCSVAVIRHEGKIVAFANMWTNTVKQEFSIDLMRYDPISSPKGVMDYLFVKLILWAQQESYEWFHLGMAPLSGLRDGVYASLWNRFGAWIYEHGSRFYNFRGLRFYKDKFDPEWSPKYLAYPGGWSLARALTDISLLNSGGVKGLLFK